LRSLADWLTYQQRAHPRAVDLSLERVSGVASRLGLLERRASLATIGGTNGKGSTATTLACLLQACGQRVGLFTSPHLVRYNERIQIDGVAACDADLVSVFEHIEAARADVTLTFFEYNALAALALFARAQVDAMVLEVGLGGRLDATNMLGADVAVLCSIGFDHRDWLGDTLEQIGAEKAGIFRAGQKVVLGSPDMPQSVWQTAKTLGCELWTAEREFSWQLRDRAPGVSGWDYRCSLCELPQLPAPTLAGQIQYRNAASALTALQLLNAPGRCDRARIERGLTSVSLPGRFQIVPGEVEWILDVAHNEPAAVVLAAALRERKRAGRTWAVLGMLSDKDAAAIAALLDPLIDGWVLTGIGDEPRGLSAAALRERLPPLRGEIELTDEVAQGCQRARSLARAGDRVIVLGSFHVVGPALAWLGLY
jgi:dihydrofolate synthase / folylpolyglutamate synthase